MIKVMSKRLVRKALDMIADLAKESYVDEDDDDDEDDVDYDDGESETKKEKVDEDDENAQKEDEDDEDKYELFWKAFGKNIKLGVIEDAANRSKLAKLLRFYSTNDPEELISLDEYISRMKPD